MDYRSLMKNSFWREQGEPVTYSFERYGDWVRRQAFYESIQGLSSFLAG